MPNQPSSEGEHSWSWFQAEETSSQAAVPMEPEAAQTILGPLVSIGLVEEEPIVVFLTKDALGLRFVPRAQLKFAECSFQKRVFCHF